MSETREIVKIPAETREKLKLIAERFAQLNTGATGDNFWIGSGNESQGYEWGQFDIGVNRDGKLITCDQGGCSCNGPEEPTVDKEYSLDEPYEIENGYYGNEKAAIEDLISTTDILYKVLTDEAVTPKEIISLPNAEVRRAVVELVGYDKVAVDAELVDAGATDGRLLRIELEGDEDLMLLHVKDPSTTREYFLRVPPTMETAKQARAWTFGFEAEDFNLTQES